MTIYSAILQIGGVLSILFLGIALYKHLVSVSGEKARVATTWWGLALGFAVCMMVSAILLDNCMASLLGDIASIWNDYITQNMAPNTVLYSAECSVSYGRYIAVMIVALCGFAVSVGQTLFHKKGKKESIESVA